MISTHDKTEILIEALPYIRTYEGKVFVIKYGGAAMINEELAESFAQDVTLLKKVGIKPVIVHGGGKEITETAARLGVESTFVDGQRYTDASMMEIVQMVLTGKTNKDIVRTINRHQGQAVGISGIDASLLRVNRYSEGDHDLGLVGTIREVNTSYLNLLLESGYLPVIAPVGVDGEGVVHNINADLAAAGIASAMGAEKLVYLSDVEGVKVSDRLIHSMDRDEAQRLIEERIIMNGMIPKIRSAFAALDSGVTKVHMIDGRVKHSLLLEIFTDEGIGTELIHHSFHNDEVTA